MTHKIELNHIPYQEAPVLKKEFKSSEPIPFVVFPTPIIPGKIKGKVTKKSFCARLFSFFTCFFKKKDKEEAANQRIIKSQKEIPRFHNQKEYIPENTRSIHLMKLDEKLFSASKDLKHKNLLTEKQVAKKAASQGIPTVQDFPISGIGSLIPKRFDGKEIIDNEILPTSHIAAKPKDPACNHLANTFSLMIDDKERAIIRTAKIDTLQKAEDFAALLLSVRDEIVNETGQVNFVLRVVSNQLNSYEIEKRTIENQHRFLAHMNKALEGKVEIVHFNTPIIGFYNVAKSMRHVPLSQRLLFRNSEERSRQQNLEGWGTYFTWIAEEFPELQKQSKKIKKSVARVQNSDLRQLAKNRRKLRNQLVSIHNELTKEGCDLMQHKQVNLFTRILASQLKIGAVLDRDHEQILLHMLNTEMQVTAQVNCKSGLDRTGGIHSLMVSLEAVSSNLGNDLACDMSLDWTSLAMQLNSASLTKHGTKNLLQSLPNEEADKLYAVMEFRKAFLSNLMRIGLPITAINTGYMGFKWQSGIYLNILENRIPLNFLPPTVYIKKDGKKIVIPLVRYNKVGKPLGLTKDGRALLTKFSEMRGP